MSSMWQLGDKQWLYQQQIDYFIFVSRGYKALHIKILRTKNTIKQGKEKIS